MSTLHFLSSFLLGRILGQEFDITSSSYVALEMGGLVHCILGNGITVCFWLHTHLIKCSIGFAVHTKKSYYNLYGTEMVLLTFRLWLLSIGEMRNKWDEWLCANFLAICLFKSYEMFALKYISPVVDHHNSCLDTHSHLNAPNPAILYTKARIMHVANDGEAGFWVDHWWIMQQCALMNVLIISGSEGKPEASVVAGLIPSISHYPVWFLPLRSTAIPANGIMLTLDEMCSNRAMSFWLHIILMKSWDCFSVWRAVFFRCLCQVCYCSDIYI